MFELLVLILISVIIYQSIQLYAFTQEVDLAKAKVIRLERLLGLMKEINKNNINN